MIWNERTARRTPGFFGSALGLAPFSPVSGQRAGGKETDFVFGIFMREEKQQVNLIQEDKPSASLTGVHGYDIFEPMATIQNTLHRSDLESGELLQTVKQITMYFRKNWKLQVFKK